MFFVPVESVESDLNIERYHLHRQGPRDTDSVLMTLMWLNAAPVPAHIRRNAFYLTDTLPPVSITKILTE